MRRISGFLEGLSASEQLVFERIALLDGVGKKWLGKLVQAKIERIK